MPPRRMSAREARANFADLLGQVYYTKEPVIVERKGRPFAVVISPEDYEYLSRSRDRDWEAIEKIRERNADARPEDVLEDVTAEVEEVRQKLHGERGGRERRPEARGQ